MEDNRGHRERMRQRFDEAGIVSFSEHEMLEFLLFYAFTRVDTKPIAKRLINEFGSLEKVFAAEFRQLTRVKGIGDKSARLICFVKQIAQTAVRRRAYAQTPVVSSASALLGYLEGVMANLPIEQFRVVYLDNSNRIIKDESLSEGVEDQTSVYPRKVMQRALLLHATGVIVAHNHPTGKLSPSNADLRITRALVSAADAVDIRFLDHIIIGCEGKGYFSFRENGLI